MKKIEIDLVNPWSREVVGFVLAFASIGLFVLLDSLFEPAKLNSQLWVKITKFVLTVPFLGLGTYFVASGVWEQREQRRSEQNQIRQFNERF